MRTRTKIITVIVVIVIVAAAVIYYFSSRMKYNDDNAIGNTTGNLYNGGLFCEYDGYVYFANPYKDYALYKMKSDGTDAKMLIGDNVSYINVCGDYIYYKRHNYKSGVEVVFKGNLYGIYRIKTNGGKTTELHRGIVGSVALSGNYLYYQNYKETTYNLYKVKIDGKDDKKISDEGYVPACFFGKRLFFSNVTGNHNLMTLNTENDSISEYMTGNIYLPDIYGDYVYYIDCDNNRALTKKNLSTGETSVISGDDMVVNYNMCGEKDVIYYQAENKNSHRLVKIDLNGNFSQTVVDGDCSNISITSEYTYFYKIFGEEKTLYRTPTTGVVSPEIFVIG